MACASPTPCESIRAGARPARDTFSTQPGIRTRRPGAKRRGATDFQRGALLAGHEWQLGRLRFSQQLGFYVYAPYPARDDVYQRYGLAYHPKGKLFLGVNLKAHRQVADFLDARVGLRL